MDSYIEALDETGNALMVYRSEVLVFSSSSSGIRPHLEAIDRLGRTGLRGTVMVDKIVGRAAALLMLYSGPSEVHAGVITYTAKGLLEAGGVRVQAAETVDAVKQKDGRIYCPFEAMVQGISDPDAAYRAVAAKMADLGSP